jgi:hypothetical protein
VRFADLNLRGVPWLRNFVAAVWDSVKYYPIQLLRSGPQDGRANDAMGQAAAEGMTKEERYPSGSRDTLVYIARIAAMLHWCIGTNALKYHKYYTAIQHYIEGCPVSTLGRTLVVNFVTIDALFYFACLLIRSVPPTRTATSHCYTLRAE